MDFIYVVDRPITGWERTHFCITADTKDAADLKIKEIASHPETMYDSEYMNEDPFIVESSYDENAELEILDFNEDN